MCKEYNGYENYQTWAVSLWLDNDEGTYLHYTERAQEILDDNDGDKDAAIRDLAAEVKEKHEENNPAQGASVFSDLMSHALCAVNWEEAVQSFFED